MVKIPFTKKMPKTYNVSKSGMTRQKTISEKKSKKTDSLSEYKLKEDTDNSIENEIEGIFSNLTGLQEIDPEKTPQNIIPDLMLDTNSINKDHLESIDDDKDYVKTPDVMPKEDYINYRKNLQDQFQKELVRWNKESKNLIVTRLDAKQRKKVIEKLQISDKPALWNFHDLQSFEVRTGITLPEHPALNLNFVTVADYFYTE